MNKLILVTLLIVMSGCSWFGNKPVDPIQVERRVQPIPVFHPPLPEGVSWQEVKWKVMTPATMAQYLKDVESGDAPVVAWYALTPEGYEALSENVADIQRYIKQSNGLLLYYRKNLVEIVVEQVEESVETEETTTEE